MDLYLRSWRISIPIIANTQTARWERVRNARGHDGDYGQHARTRNNASSDVLMARNWFSGERSGGKKDGFAQDWQRFFIILFLKYHYGWHLYVCSCNAFSTAFWRHYTLWSPLQPFCTPSPSLLWWRSLQILALLQKQAGDRRLGGANLGTERTLSSTGPSHTHAHVHTQVTSPWHWHTPFKDMEKWAIMHLSCSVLIQDTISALNYNNNNTISIKWIKQSAFLSGIAIILDFPRKILVKRHCFGCVS